MLLRRPLRVVALAALLAGCKFEPSGELDAAVVDALDAPVDATDAPIDACIPATEQCNGLDDDCDTMTDEGFAGLGAACDGADTDQCLDDVTVCDAAGTGTECGGPAPDDDGELCNQLDDDCDTRTDEAFPTLGMMCDGADQDLCREGTFACDAAMTGVVCGDTTTDTVELCNMLDDDCDTMTDEAFATLGDTCDGMDGDACLEGTIECDLATGGVRCSDTTTTIGEACDSMDNDCDVTVDEGFDLTTDVNNCGVCGRQCTNAHGTTACAAGTCVPACTTPGAHDCDGNPTNGCEPRNTGSACTSTVDMGNVRGDAGADVQTETGYTEGFFLASVTDSIAGSTPLLARIDLVSPPGTNFDLFVTCRSCAGVTLSSTSTGTTDTVNIGRTDMSGNFTYDIFIEVRWVSSSACGNWTLTVTGNQPTTNRSCN